MEQENVIEIEHLTKTYRIYNKPVDRLKETLSLTKKTYSRDFHALNDVSFSVKKGENIGIIGTNGSGKSTILKIITGVLSPTSGNVTVRGKIAALLELGAGFNPEYTGVENIYLNGTMMGFTREEMDKKVEGILAFADIGDFVHQPMKTYSSGMFARLAFAVAINVEPEILIVDEALSVGDMKFQTKCIDKMNEIQKNGTTILFVSHSIGQINRFCHRCIWIERGILKSVGKTSDVTNQYENYLKYGEQEVELPVETEADAFSHDTEFVMPEDSNIMASITNTKINGTEFKTFDSLEVLVEYEVYVDKIPGFLLGVAILGLDGQYIFGPNTHLEKKEIPATCGRHCVKYSIPKLPLLTGAYTINVGIFNNKGIVDLDYKSDIGQFTVGNDYISEGLVYMEQTWDVLK